MNLTYLIRREIKLVIVSIFCFLLTVFGLSYGFLTSDNNDLSTDLSVGSATFPLILSDNTTITETDIEPGDTFTKTITVENRGNRTVKYNLIWFKLLNEIELQLSATCSSNIQGNTCSAIAAQTIPMHSTEVNDELIKKNISIAAGETHTYVITVKFKDEEYLEEDYGTVKNFHGKINIEEYQYVPATLALTVDNGTSGISTGDLITISKSGIPNQDFYVVSSDASETVLLAKYSLLVGNLLNYDFENDSLTWIKTYSSQDDGYGLQSSAAKGMSDVSQLVATPFSAINYWYDELNDDLYSTYGTLSNAANDVYDPNYSNVALSIDHTDPTDIIVNENNYSIAYYVEEYVNRLGINGTGRLLTVAEAVSLGCTRDPDNDCSLTPTWLNNETSYWLGSVSEEGGLYSIWYDGAFTGDEFNNYFAMGVRPVIVINTSDIDVSN